MKLLPLFLASFLAVETMSGAVHAEIQYVRNEPGKIGVVVFVHGITGGEETWQNSELGKPSWPDLVARDALFEDVNIVRYNYDSSLFLSPISTDDLARELNREVRTIIDRYERIFFVSHSLGTIITTKLMLANRDIARKTRAAFYFSPPFAGSQLAAALSLSIYSSRLIKDLTSLTTENRKDTFLTALRDNWRNSKLPLQIPVYCAYETRSSTLPASAGLLRKRVVNPDSAERLCTASFSPVEKDHLHIVRPEADKAFLSHEYLKDWYSEVFPGAVRAEGDKNSDVVLADCAVDRYGNDFKAAMFEDVFNITGQRLRLTRRLPEDWRPAHFPLLWGRENPPKLVLIHYSCFQQGEERSSSAANRERADDFERLLATLRDSAVKILVYSRAFETEAGEDYLFEYPTAAQFRRENRIFTFATSHALSYSEDKSQRMRFVQLLKNILDETPIQPKQKCRC